jgi:hypothetical protein
MRPGRRTRVGRPRKEIEELEARRREVGREFRRKKEGAPRRILVKEGMELDRKIGQLRTGRPKKVVPHVRSSAPKMGAVTIGRGRPTHLVQEPKEERTRPLKILCGLTLMGEPTQQTENRSLEKFLRSLDEYADPLCARCRGGLKVD